MGEKLKNRFWKFPFRHMCSLKRFNIHYIFYFTFYVRKIICLLRMERLLTYTYTVLLLSDRKNQDNPGQRSLAFVCWFWKSLPWDMLLLWISFLSLKKERKGERNSLLLLAKRQYVKYFLRVREIPLYIKFRFNWIIHLKRKC